MLLLCAGLLAATLPIVPVADADGPFWVTAATDPMLDAQGGVTPGVALDARADLTRLFLADDAGWIHARLWTRAPVEAPSPPPGPPGLVPSGEVSTTISFAVEAANGTSGGSYRIVAAPGPNFTLYRGTEPVQGVTMLSEGGDTPWNFTLRFSRSALADVAPRAGDRLALVHASSVRSDGGTDRAPDVGYGTYLLKADPGADPHGGPVPTWEETTGVDYAGGPGVATATDGSIHVGYYVYRSDQGAAVGIWHARVESDGTVTTSFVGPGAFRAGDDQSSRDAQTQVAIAVGERDQVHLLYLSDPWSTGGALRYAAQGRSGWSMENPNELASGNVLPTTGGYRSVPDIVAREGRIVAAFQSEDLDTVQIVERTGDGWKDVTSVDGARFPNLAVGGDGAVHLAFFRGTSDESSDGPIYGELVYATEGSGWSETVIATGIEDRSTFWETTETDGSFAFALSPTDQPYFVYETRDDERGFVVLSSDGRLHRESTPLTPDHGNIQNRMRMVVDVQGRAHVVSGYGGADLYGLRGLDGSWSVESIPRHDLFDLALTPDGRAVQVYTQPHGGTTLALSAQRHVAGAPAPGAKDGDQSAYNFAPGLEAPLLVALGLGGVALVTGGGRAAVDRRPGWAAPAFALLGGFSRIHKNKVLEHRTREDILDAIRAEPGATATQIRAKLGLPRSTFFYHLERLQKESLVAVGRRGGRVWLFPTGSVPAAPGPVHVEVLEATRSDPGRTAAEYAERLGRSRRTILHHLQELERRNEITRFQLNPRNVRWGIVPDADLEEGG